MVNDFDLGERLRAVRQMQGLSQRELAKRAGVSNAIISLIEQNRTSPSVGSLKKVLGGIPMSLADFFAGELTPRRQVFFSAADLVEIAGRGGLSYRQVGPDLAGHALAQSGLAGGDRFFCLPLCFRGGEQADHTTTVIAESGSYGMSPVHPIAPIRCRGLAQRNR